MIAMFAVVLSWLFCLSPTSVNTKNLIAVSDTITVGGSCWDVLTGVNVKSSITAVVNGQKHRIGYSNENGEFTLRLADSIQALSFEVKGYPTATVPVNRSGKIAPGARFWVNLPILRSDSQLVKKNYQPIASPGDQPAKLNRKTQKVYFQVQDARTFRRIRATICFHYLSLNRTNCFNVDSAKVPSFTMLNRDEKIGFEVRADGYQPYYGQFDGGQAGTNLYQIKLLLLNNVLVASYDFPATLKLDHFEVRTRNNALHVYGQKVPDKSFGWNHFKPGDVYKFIATAENGQVVADETFRMAPGFTFVEFHWSQPKSSRLLINEPDKFAFFDSTVLHFDQCAYSLRQEVRGKLDSISWEMIKLRDVKAQLMGHTDNVGQRNLNTTLSEYRTRAVSSYLHQKGIPLSQLSSSWKGSDAPAAPNDTEENKAKNRRVVIRFYRH